MTYTVVEARAQLPKLLREVEKGEAVEITRRGKLVAVVVGAEEYRRMSGGRRTFRQAYEAFRQKHPPEDLDLDGVLDGLRDRAPGREVDLTSATSGPPPPAFARAGFAGVTEGLASFVTEADWLDP